MHVELDHLVVETEGPIARVTLNRPERRNALSGGMLDAFTLEMLHQPVRRSRRHGNAKPA